MIAAAYAICLQGNGNKEWTVTSSEAANQLIQRGNTLIPPSPPPATKYTYLCVFMCVFSLLRFHTSDILMMMIAMVVFVKSWRG